MSSSSKPALSLEQAHPVRRTARLAILTNMIPPYRRPVLARLSQRYPHLRVLVSTPSEPNRSWGLNWDGLDVILQKTVTLRGKWRHPKGFNEPLFIHIPIDTFAQLKRFNAEVVLSAEMGARTLLSLLYCKLRRNSKLIIWAEISESSEQGRGRLRSALRSLLARHADAFIVYGESGARYVRTLHVPESKIFVVPYSTDVNRFAQNSLTRTPEQARRLLYVGQLIDRKGLLSFIAALSKWASAHRDRAIELLLVGEGPLRDHLNNTPHPANLNITLAGNVPYDDLPQVYAESGVFVFPTLADTWGLVVNEAMAGGLPILGSVYSQAVETLVEDGNNGWTFRPDNMEQTYAAIDRCMSIAIESLDEMRKCARAVALQHSPEHVASLIDDVLITCLNRTDHPREVADVR